MNLTQMTTLKRGTETYPVRLENLPDPPQQIQLVGHIPDQPMVAIVGSRNADTAACTFAYRMAGELAHHNIATISGGALGIDTAAHKGALEAGGRTISVIGSGLGFLYPESNRTMFEEIAATGALVTEFHHDQPPTRWTFPKRNRLVAALSDAVLVVQAGNRSGALITAKWATRLDVPVGAIPGPPGEIRNQGNHKLLREGAHLIEDVGDVLDILPLAGLKKQMELPAVRPACKLKTDNNDAKQSPLEMKILEILSSTPLHIDNLTTSLGIAPGETSAAILALELQGLVEDRGGKNFIRVG